MISYGIEPVVKLMESDNVAAEILKECRSGNYDVIVMGVLVESACPVIMFHVPGE